MKITIYEGFIAAVLTASLVTLPVSSECDCFPRPSTRPPRPGEAPRRCCEYDCGSEEECTMINDVLACIFTQNKTSMECRRVVNCQEACDEEDTERPNSRNRCGFADSDQPLCYGCVHDTEDADDTEGAQDEICNMNTVQCVLSENVISQACTRIQSRYMCVQDEELCDSEDDEENSKPPPSLTVILVPAIVCGTVVLLIIVLAVILALYWRFRIQVIKERKAVTTYDVTAISAGQPLQADPLYSVLDSSLPPALPPDRVPYYQEIQSDAVPVANYEEPTSVDKNMKVSVDPGMKMEAGVKLSGTEPYQEPVDALKYYEEEK